MPCPQIQGNFSGLPFQATDKKNISIHDKLENPFKRRGMLVVCFFRFSSYGRVFFCFVFVNILPWKSFKMQGK